MEKLFIVILLACLLLNLIISDIQRKRDKQKYINLRKKYNDLAMKTGNDHIALSFIENSQIDAIRQMKENG